MVSLHVTSQGSEGTPIVFTHGWVDDQTVWAGVRDEMEARWTVAWDLRAHGQSDAPPPGNYGRHRALEDMHSVVSKVAEPVILAGHSLGGYLSLAYALVHPDLVAGLVLVAAGPGFRNEDAREQWNAAVDSAATKLDIPAGSEVLSKHTDSWVLDELESITVPTVVVVGEHDKRFHAAVGLFESKLNVIHSVTVPNAGHSVHRKHPGPVAEAIKYLD